MPKPNGSRIQRCSGRSFSRWFSMKMGSVTKASHPSCKQWAIGIYLFSCNLVGPTMLHLRGDLGHRRSKVRQNCAKAPFAVSEDIVPDEVAIEVEEACLGVRKRIGIRSSTFLDAGSHGTGRIPSGWCDSDARPFSIAA